LISAGFIDEIPVRPIWRRFYLDPDGRVRSSSKFAA